MHSNDIPNIPKEKFNFVTRHEKIHDTEFKTKPVGYLKDALYRFRKNKSSVVAFYVLLLVVIFAAIGPLVTLNKFPESDINYKTVLPKMDFFAQFGFLDGTEKREMKQYWYDYYSAMPGAIEQVYSTVESKRGRVTDITYTVKFDTYDAVGYKYFYVSKSQFDAIQAYEKENNMILLEPLVDMTRLTKVLANDDTDANVWYERDARGIALRDKDGNMTNIFVQDSSSEYGDGYAHFEKQNENKYKIRVLYKEYYKYLNGRYPGFYFGTDNRGFDIFVRLSIAIRFSLLMGTAISVINLVIGTIFGALQGYYGGWFDLISERVIDIIARIPFLVLLTLLLMFVAKDWGMVPTIGLAFVLNGWIGAAGRTRVQFYRFKGREYVMASRTLGAKDGRLIFKHILPNAIGTLITGSILTIPSFIFSESMFSYLGIINLDGKELTSVGTMLANGQAVMADYPHVILFPSIVISILMISFNMFGNGLRDAFNPSLRGAE